MIHNFICSQFEHGFDFLFTWAFEGIQDREKNKYFFRLKRDRYDTFLKRHHSVWVNGTHNVNWVD